MVLQGCSRVGLRCCCENARIDHNGSELLRSAHRGGSTALTQSVEIRGNPLAHMTGYKDEKNCVKLNVTFKQVLEQEGEKKTQTITRSAEMLLL